MNRIYVLFTLLWATVLQAQVLQLNPLGSVAFEKEWIGAKSGRDVSDSLQLPFVEDFSYPGPYPDGRLWLSPSVFISGTLPYLPPTIGVATLDGLRWDGLPYATQLISGAADTLLSRPFRMNFPASDSLYMSFYVQPGGLGNYPEFVDSLMLEFYSPVDSLWRWVWGTKGEDYPQLLTGFRKVMLPIRDTLYLRNGFQFRFRNFAQLNGSWDHWNIDYIEIDRFRNRFDTLHTDFAFMYPPKSLLHTYQSLPLWHFLPQANENMDDFYNLSLTTLNAFPSNRFYGYDFYNAIGEVVDFLQFENQGPIIPRQEYVLEEPVKYTYEDPGTEWTVYYLQHFLSDNVDSLTRNDTATYVQVLSNYYALDDGSAEARVSINNNGGGFVAQRFESYIADTLKAVQLFLNRTVQNGAGQEFFLMIWAAGNNQPGQLIHQQSLTYPDTEGLNQFSTIALSAPLYLPAGSYYVGWAQTSNFEFNLGFDRNINNNDRIYYNLDGTWYNYSAAEGTLMIRPVFRYPYDIYVGQQSTAKPNAEWLPLPNPTNGIVRIAGNFDPSASWVLMDLNGRMVANGKLDSNPQIDFSSYPAGMYFLGIEEKSDSRSYIWRKVIRSGQ